MRESGDFVAGFGRPDAELAGYRPIAGMQAQRLLRRQAPVPAEAFFQVGGTKAPERRIPGRAFSTHFVRTARDEPAFDDLLEKAVLNEAFPVRARQVP